MADINNIFEYGASLISTQNRVEVPFIIIKIGDYTLGDCKSLSNSNRLQSAYKVTFPNFIDSMTVTKINGALNVYEIKIKYAITNIDDPNLIEKVLSSVSMSRKIVISYGDWNTPNYIYKNEEALITKVTTQVNFASSSIDYKIKATSTAMNLSAISTGFPAQHKKPSDIIKTLLANESYGLLDIFPGMRNKENLSRFIASDDKAVDIPAKPYTNVLDYLSFLVKYMISTNEKSSGLKKSLYYWYVCDDLNNEYGGAYFKIIRVDSNPSSIKSYDTYELDIGYPSANYVTDFSVNNDDSWSILYNYSEKVQMPEYSYNIDNQGNIVSNYSPIITNSPKYMISTEATKTWWSMATNFPITANLTIKGLLRPTTLMSYIKINCYFYGHKHIASGVYIITKQVDTISSNGYKTQLSLTRISGDEG